MADQLIIFGATYLFLFIPVLAFVFFLKQSRDIQKQIILFGGILLPAAYLAARLAQLFYYNPRPFMQNDFIPRIPHIADNGFPSDHTLISAAISAVVFPFNKKLGSVLWCITVLVGVSRVLAGVHHGIDVIGSIGIAAGAGVFVYYGAKRRGIIA